MCSHAAAACLKPNDAPTSQNITMRTMTGIFAIVGTISAIFSSLMGASGIAIGLQVAFSILCALTAFTGIPLFFALAALGLVGGSVASSIVNPPVYMTYVPVIYY